MKLQYLKDDELEISFQHAVKTERKIIHIVILHIQELNRRKLFLARGYPSLFEYLVREAKYSSSAAQRRIEAARLVTAVPAVADKLQSGDINLSQIGEIQRAVKEAQKIHRIEITNEAKTELVELVLNQNHSNTQQICAVALNIPITDAEAINTQKDRSKRIEITFTAEQFAKYEQVRDKLAHQNFQQKRSQKIADVLETLFDQILKTKALPNSSDVQSEGTVLSKSPLPGSSLNCTSVTATECLELVSWKSLTHKRKQTILATDQCCQFVDKKSGRRCASKFNLEVDHIQPKWDHGNNQQNNLRVLCRNHNQYRELRV